MSADKNNTATSHLVNVQEAHLLLRLGTRGALAMSEIAAALQLSLSSVTTTVDKLENKALVLRERSDEDRRVVRVGLTPKGREFCDLVEEGHLDLTVSILDALEQTEQETLLEMFRKVTARLNQDRSPA